MKEKSKKLHKLENKCLRISENSRSTSSQREAARCELVDLLFSLVWVPGKRLMSLLGHWPKSL